MENQTLNDVPTKVLDILNQTGLNWEVEKHKIFTESNIEIPDKVALLRSDNNAVLSVMGDKYEVFQNYELCEVLFQISQHTGLQVHTGGYFGNGEKVFIQLKSDDFNLNGDTIKGFITGASSHDGGTSLAFGNSTLTISCLNTFFKSFKTLDSKFKHTQSMRPKLDQILKGIDILLKEEKDDFKIIKRMSEMVVTPEIKELVTRTLFQLSREDMLIRTSLSSIKQNQIIKFETDWDKEVSQKGDNLWGAMSAVTKYTTHTAPKNHEKGQYNKMFGALGDREKVVWNQLTAMVR
jgi:phage/plasmid-like protein (TIGR03299 family)